MFAHVRSNGPTVVYVYACRWTQVQYYDKGDLDHKNGQKQQAVKPVEGCIIQATWLKITHRSKNCERVHTHVRHKRTQDLGRSGSLQGSSHRFMATRYESMDDYILKHRELQRKLDRKVRREKEGLGRRI
ncbi:hypothetical protein KQX54_019233 [Cotesia glomerata]|uniref:Uncharacterized protein n=1 Tax=Cotesia glomerata TaxID=32391 RepID=A0AAV7ICC5_COTGL|nr:hypothetical protein KQX54_019233 [Cotesia glomerata]